MEALRGQMTPRVSILIPCFNAAPWLAATLDSAFAQTWPACEIILVDDGSTDGSLAIARRYEARGLKVIVQANRGASAARNTALRTATGDYMQYLDADDLLAPDKIAMQMKLASAVGDRFAICGCWSRFVSDINEAIFPTEVLCIDAPVVDWMIAKLEHHAMMHPAAWLTSRHLSDQAGPWNESLSLDDDGEYFNRVVMASDGMRFCPEAVSYYRSQITGSLSKARSERAWTSALTSLELSADRLVQLENSPRINHACATAFQRYVYEAYPQAASCRQRALIRVRIHGGSDLQPEYGPKFKLLARFVGWRLAKRAQHLISR